MSAMPMFLVAPTRGAVKFDKKRQNIYSKIMKKLLKLCLPLILSFFLLTIASQPAKASNFPGGKCCRQGHPEDCGPEKNWSCRGPYSPECQSENKGDCVWIEPHSWFEPTYEEYEQTLRESGETNELNKESSWQNSLNLTVLGLTRMIIGPSPSSSSTTYRPGGALGGISNLMAALYAHPPASSLDYLADLGKNLEIVKPVYAQSGIGFRGLRPILPLWKAFRDVAYLFFTIVFVIIGFALMFRVKLDPQTVIGIQNAIPRIIIALILVTFSYAIAGLLIDLIYVLIALVSVVLGSTGLLNATKAQNVYLEASPLTLLGAFLLRGEKAAAAASQALDPAAYNDLFAILKSIPFFGDAMEAPSSLLSLILVIILLIAFFKVFLTLLFAYVRILIGIVFGPLQIMLGALPGQNSFMNWLSNLLSNIIVFPTVVTMFLLVDVILAATQNQKGNDYLWAPPFFQTAAFKPSSRILGGLIAYGLFLLTPKVTEMIKAVFERKPFPYGTAIGEAFGPIIGPARFGGQIIGKGITGYGGGRIETALGRFLTKPEKETTTSKAIKAAGGSPPSV